MWLTVQNNRIQNPVLQSVLYKELEEKQEKEMATHSSNLAWRILWTEEPGGLLSIGWHRVGHNSSNLAAGAAEEQPEILECGAFCNGWPSSRFVLPGIWGNGAGIFFQQIIGQAKLITCNQDRISALFPLVGLTYWKLLSGGHSVSLPASLCPQDMFMVTIKETASTRR